MNPPRPPSKAPRVTVRTPWIVTLVPSAPARALPIGIGVGVGLGDGVAVGLGVGVAPGVRVGAGVGDGGTTGGDARFCGIGLARTAQSKTLLFVSVLLPEVPPGLRSMLEPAGGAAAGVPSTQALVASP